MAYPVRMTIQLKPEIEQLIQQNLATGAYASIEEFVERAVLLLHQDELDLFARREEISAKIEEGWAAAKRGELMSEAEVMVELEKRKQAWRAARSV